jgi:sortase A
MKRSFAAILSLGVLALADPAAAQTADSVSGVVVSSSADSLVIRLDDGSQRTFVTDGTTTMPSGPLAEGSPVTVRFGRAWGRIVIPRLGLDALVAEGIDAATLRVAVGHVPDTAFPDELGNVALAGHRDTVFRPLRELQPGDVITVTTPLGAFSYEVDTLEVVAPDETDVIAPVPEPVLTLVTCYPFGYLGRAPQRFVVRARLAQPAPRPHASRPAR